MRDWTALGIIAVALVVIVRTVARARHPPRRRLRVEIEWIDDSTSGQDSSGDVRDLPQDGSAPPGCTSDDVDPS